MTLTERRDVPTMLVCLLTGLAMGCGDGTTVTALGVGGLDGEGEREEEGREFCVDPESEHAVVETQDLRRGQDFIPVDITIDGCVPEGAYHAVRGQNTMSAVEPGVHTLSITVDGVELPPQEISAEDGDRFYFVMDENSPPALYRTDKKLPESADAWQVNLMNMTGEPITISRATDPDATEFEVVLADIPHGGAFAGELPFFAESGVPIRVERGGEVVLDENLGFFIDCRPGTWIGWASLFAVIQDPKDTEGLPFGHATASMSQRCL